MRSRIILAALPIAFWERAKARRRIEAPSPPARRCSPTAESMPRPASARGAGSGMRTIPKADIGTVEQRALIGGAPYECMTVAGSGRCLWVVP